MAAIDASKPIAFCEHLQLSSLGVQPASISFQVRATVLLASTGTNCPQDFNS
jgi:hypothetical protein